MRLRACAALQVANDTSTLSSMQLGLLTVTVTLSAVSLYVSGCTARATIMTGEVENTGTKLALKNDEVSKPDVM